MRAHLSILLTATLLQGALAEDRLHYSTAQKQWGLAASAVLTQRNSHDLYSLSGVPDSNWEREKQKKFLVEGGWAVMSREDLLETMTRLLDGGHRASYDEIRQEIAAPKSKAQQFICALKGEIPTPAYRIEFMKKHEAAIGEKSLTGWDLSRLICLARWGVGAGYLEEDEAWDWIMPAAVEIQETYASWNELGEAFLLGREFWSPGAMRKSGYRYQAAVYWLESNEHSPWVRFDWSLDLTGSVAEIAGDSGVPPAAPYYEGARFGAFDEYERSLAALLVAKDQGDEFSRGLCHGKLGNYYTYGRTGIAKDLKKGLSFYEEGARLGDDGSLLDLGNAYFNGKGRPKDYAKAFDFWSRAAEQGSVIALDNLGLAYARGSGVQKDIAKALKLYERGLELGARNADNSIAWLMYKNEEIWDADAAVTHSYAAIRKSEKLTSYDTLVKVLIKAERWDEAWSALKAWERFDMRKRDNYDELALPKRFKRFRSIIQEGKEAST